MEGIVTGFKQELDLLARRFEGRPRQEVIRLLLLSLEREGLVTIAYREELMLQRLRRMDIPDAVRDLIHHALVWAWRDEEMHTVYLRGALLKLGNVALRLQAYAREATGYLGGWASSVQQHVPWSHAPLSRSLAGGVLLAGRITGQAPREVSEYLRYQPFREFCRFNVAAEETAALCYARLLAIAEQHADVLPLQVEEVTRIRDDEERHGRVFACVAECLGPDDRLAGPDAARRLEAGLSAVGEYFLPRRLREKLSRENPLGSGGVVRVDVGSGSEEKRAVFRRHLEALDLESLLQQRAAETGKRRDQLRVAVKPTFMLGYHRRDRSTITDPELLEELARQLTSLGCEDVAVVESENIYDRFYRSRTVGEVARYFDLSSPSYRIVDLSAEQEPCQYARGLAQYTVGRTWRDADVRISFGKLRSHPIEGASLTLGNLEGTGARCDEFLFAERQAHRETALMMLLDQFPPHLALLDGYDLAPDGLMGVMGCRNPPSPRRLYGGRDALAVDLAAARHLHPTIARRSRFLRTACHWFGDPSACLRVEGCDEPVPGWRDPYSREWTTLLSLAAYPVYQFGSCRGALFTPEMDPEAFPPLQPESLPLRTARRAVRALVGLRLPAKGAE